MVAMAALIAATPCIAAELPLIGDQPPGLSLPNLDSKTVNLSDFYGKPIILTFFTSWSKSCQDELLALKDMAATYAPTLEIIGVSFDKKSKSLSEFAEKQNLPFVFLIDKKLSSLNKYAILIIPTTFAIGSDGKIKTFLIDYDDNIRNSLEEFIRGEISPK